jgi:hypothetical protein
MDSQSRSALALRLLSWSLFSSETRRRALLVLEKGRRSRCMRVMILLDVLRASCGRMAGMKQCGVMVVLEH